MNIRTLHCFIRTMLISALLFSQLPLPALAQTQTSTISVKINGQLQQYEQPPVNANGSVLVPMRAIFEALGAKVIWEASTKDAVATKGNTTVGIRIGETMALINSNYLKLQQPAQMVNGYTMVPVRFVSEALGARVEWDVDSQTVVINTRLDRNAAKEAASPMGIPIEAEWKTFNTDYFEIHYYKAEEQVFQDSYEFDDIYKKAVEKFGHKPALLSAEQTRIPILILAEDDFKRVLQINSDAAWSTKRKAVFINLRESEKIKGVNDLYIFVRHELTHAITLNSAESKVRNIPFWIKEGVTTAYDVEPPYLQSSREPSLKKAFLAGSLLTWSEMWTPGDKWDQDKFILAYAEAQSIYRYLSSTYGEKKIADLFFTDGDYKSLLEQATGKSITDLEKEWLDFVKKNYSARNGYFIEKGPAGTTVYEGEFKDDKYHGKGIRYYQDGMKYEGDFVEGIRNGKGKTYRADGSLLYEGEYSNDKGNGIGKFYYTDGPIFYEGEVKDGLLHGQGTRYYNDGKYIGEFKKGNRDGNGKFYDKKDRLQYEGEYKDDKRNGHGILYNLDGSVRFEGEFKDNKPVE